MCVFRGSLQDITFNLLILNLLSTFVDEIHFDVKKKNLKITIRYKIKVQYMNWSKC
jgi:hypothetical protein